MCFLSLQLLSWMQVHYEVLNMASRASWLNKSPVWVAREDLSLFKSMSGGLFSLN